MDSPTFLEEKRVELTNGLRQAVATLRRYEEGWLVHRIVEEGRPDVEEHVDVFPTSETAAKAAKTLWIL